MEVAFSPQAEAELAAALEYHSDPAAADRFSVRVERLIQQMQHFPEAARARPDLTRRDVRLWLVAPFWFVTQQRPEVLLVVTVVHASRDLRTCLRGIV